MTNNNKIYNVKQKLQTLSKNDAASATLALFACDSAVSSIHKVMHVHQALLTTGHGTEGHIGDKMAPS